MLWLDRCEMCCDCVVFHFQSPVCVEFGRFDLEVFGRRGKYDCLGTFSKTSTTVVQITELPLKKWTQDYKEFLASALMQCNDM